MHIERVLDGQLSNMVYLPKLKCVNTVMIMMRIILILILIIIITIIIIIIVIIFFL